MASGLYPASRSTALVEDVTRRVSTAPDASRLASLYSDDGDRSRALYGFTPAYDTSGPYARQPRPFLLTGDIANSVLTQTLTVFRGLLTKANLWVFELMPLQEVDALSARIELHVINYNAAILDETPALGISREVSQLKESYSTTLERRGIRFTIENDVANSAVGEAQYYANMYQMKMATQKFIAQSIIYAMLDVRPGPDTFGRDAEWNLSYEVAMTKSGIYSMLANACALWGCMSKKVGFEAMLLIGSRILTNRTETPTDLIIPADSVVVLKSRALVKMSDAPYKTDANEVLKGPLPLSTMDGGLKIREMWKLPDESPGPAKDPLVMARRYAEYYTVPITRLEGNDGTALEHYEDSTFAILDHDTDSLKDISIHRLIRKYLTFTDHKPLDEINGFVLWRSGITYAMGSSIMVAGERPIGHAFTRSSNHLAGQDVNLKTTHVNFTVETGTMVTRRAAVQVLYNTFCEGYVGGGGVDFDEDIAITAYSGDPPTDRWLPMTEVSRDIAAEPMGLPDNIYPSVHSRIAPNRSATGNAAFAGFTTFMHSVDDGPIFAGRGCVFYQGVDTAGRLSSRGAVRSPCTMWGTSVEYDGVVADRCGRGAHGFQLTDNEQPHLRAVYRT